MKSHSTRHLFIGLAMLAAAGMALGLSPRRASVGQEAEIKLDTLIPKQFGEWRLDETVAPTLFSADVQAEMDKIYNQMLDRTYVNRRGEKIMLMIAYGGNQSYSMQVHRPEVCYPALGFDIGEVTKDFLDASGTRLPVMKMVATMGSRIEPVTYWVMIGDSPVRGNIEQHLARVKYGLTGKVPVGLLIRVSTISADATHSYRIEESFLREMLAAVPVKHRKALTGAN